jgi:23S rRNA (cytidine1920-2'-O)/16S rRNA (cytidine1409-2'-O)-methyltransferase
VSDPEQHARVVAEVNAVANQLGLVLRGVIESPIQGAEGNREFLAAYQRQ